MKTDGKFDNNNNNNNKDNSLSLLRKNCIYIFYASYLTRPLLGISLHHLFHRYLILASLSQATLLLALISSIHLVAGLPTPLFPSLRIHSMHPFFPPCNVPDKHFQLFGHIPAIPYAYLFPEGCAFHSDHCSLHRNLASGESIELFMCRCPCLGPIRDHRYGAAFKYLGFLLCILLL